MTEKELKELLIKKNTSEEWLYSFIAVFTGIFLLFVGTWIFALVCFVLAIPLYFLGKYINKKNMDYVENDPIYLICDNNDTLLKIMDEVINRPFYNTNNVHISEHFMFYGNYYHNLICLNEINTINYINDVDTNKIFIEDIFNRRKIIKINNKDKANEVYDNLKKYAINAKEDKSFILEKDYLPSIKRDKKITLDYAFNIKTKEKSTTKKNTKTTKKTKKKNK